jgi:ubiquinone/menaquinone biosynthesis C-methylase UbiE
MNPTSAYSEQLVLRVNEIYHDFANPHYDDIHREQIGSEGERWRRLAARFLPASPFVLADIGTGLGLVPVSIGGLLKPEDRLIASDLSQGMLDAARRNIEREKFPWSVEYVKLTGTVPYRLPFESGSLDVVTMSSVLHHIKETGAFLGEIDRVLKPGGIFFIAHEPNALFRHRKLLWGSYRFLYALLNPTFALRSRPARALGIYSLTMKIYHRLRPGRGDTARAMMSTINDQLLREGLIRAPLGLDEIGEITDILDREGFDPLTLVPAYEVLHLESYNHIGQVSIDKAKNRLVSAYDRWLGKRYPTSGSTFFLVLHKPQSD